MSATGTPMQKIMKTRWITGLASCLLGLTIALPSAFAQEEEEEEEKKKRPPSVLPLKKGTPLFDKRPLRIPGKVKDVRKTPRGINKPLKRQPVSAPPPAKKPKDSKPGFGQIKKTSGLLIS